LTSVLSFGLWVADITYVIQHSDQGRQYTAVAFGKRCREAGVRPSMGWVDGAYAQRAVSLNNPATSGNPSMSTTRAK
jgi:hypothetical protein